MLEGVGVDVGAVTAPDGVDIPGAPLQGAGVGVVARQVPVPMI